MRVYMGSFREKNVEGTIKQLRRNGVNVHKQPALQVDVDHAFYMEGTIRELEEKYAGTELASVVDEWKQYFDAARQVMEDGMKTQEFERPLLDIIMPEQEEYRELEKKFLGKVRETAGVMEENGMTSVEENMEKTVGAVDQVLEETVEMEEMDEREMEEFIRHVDREIQTILTLYRLLEANGVEFREGRMYGAIPDDPVLKVNIEAAPDEAEEWDLDLEGYYSVTRVVDVYLDLMDSLFKGDELEQIYWTGGRESKGLFEVGIAGLVAANIEDAVDGKKDVDAFVEEVKTMDLDHGRVMISEEAVRGILESLDEEGMVKLKRGNVYPGK